MSHESADTGPLPGLEGFQKMLGHRSRLGICALLARNDELSFSRLKELLSEKDGSLGAQLRKLEDEGFVTVRKEFQDRKPISWYQLTTTGRQRLEVHLAALSGLLGTDE
ncbi:MAG: transcriptional regulator [Verrucomicrobia bacterium]|nr:MAG: transcriptional regulator [Verrucomicrobiota bacterium]